MEKENFKLNGIDVEVLLEEGAEKPKYGHVTEDGIPGDYCLDIKATSCEYNEEMDCYIYHTGLRFKMPEMTAMLIYPRSSNRKTDAYICNHVCIIDWMYNKEVLICMKNRTSMKARAAIAEHDIVVSGIMNRKGLSDIRKDIENMPKLNPMDYAPYKAGNKIAQLVVVEYKKTNLIEVDSIKDSGRGGFGSTGE